MDPRILLIAGAACISVSAIFVRFSAVSAGTAAFYRCVLALPVLVPLVLWERRRSRPGRSAQERREPGCHGTHLLAGLLLGVDLVLWGASIERVGAGLSRVRAETGGTILLLQPILAVLFGVVLLAERPTPWQITGCALVVAAVWLTGRTGPVPAPPPEPAPPPGPAPARPVVSARRAGR